MDNTIIQIDLDIIKYLNERTCDEIIKLLTSKNLLGKGFWGSVYKFEIKGHKVSVKIQPLENDKMYDASVEDKRNIELEIDLLKKISQYKIKNSFGHFPYFYFSRTCSNESLMFYEYYSYNLKQFFYKEYKLRNIFKRLLQSWRLYKINKTYVPDIDLITLAEPQKPITIYDWTIHKKFVFDAKGLANSIQSSLLYYEGCFAMPKTPKNVMINTEFTFAQLVSIYYQLRERGELNWTISTMKKFNFSINRWKLYNKSQYIFTHYEVR
jgi:hypothetical protein